MDVNNDLKNTKLEDTPMQMDPDDSSGVQPPSGKGSHKPTCTCDVCMTVKRRFRNLRMRRRKGQSEREADATEKEQVNQRDESEANGASRDDAV